MVSMELAANYSDLYRHYYEKYMKLIGPAKWNPTKYDMYKKNMTKIHREFINHFQFDIEQYMKIIINNVSLPFKYESSFAVISKKMKLYIRNLKLK